MNAIYDYLINFIKQNNMTSRVSPREFDRLARLFRGYFLEEIGFTESFTQNRLNILSACEDPNTMTMFGFGGVMWPQKQTGQMDLEDDLLNDPSLKGLICVTCSYRNEPNPIPGRHDKIFPMFEFETHGDMEDLIQLESGFLDFLGFSKYRSQDGKGPYIRFTYEELCKKYNVTELEHEHEKRMEDDFGPVVFITDFPERTSPFWNMKRQGRIAKKVDVILHGIETFGSAERSCHPEEMRHRFNTIENGGYAKRLFQECGQDRTLKERDDFMTKKFIPRSGGGIGVTRLIRAMKMSNLL